MPAGSKGQRIKIKRLPPTDGHVPSGHAGRHRALALPQAARLFSDLALHL